LKFFDFDPGDIANAQRTLAKGARALLGGLWHSGKSRS
jgi:hypothetical protein